MYNSVLIDRILHSFSFKGSTFILRRVEQICLNVLLHYNCVRPGDGGRKPSAEMKETIAYSLLFDSEGLFKDAQWYIARQGRKFVRSQILNVENGAVSNELQITPQNFEFFTKLMKQHEGSGRAVEQKNLCIII